VIEKIFASPAGKHSGTAFFKRAHDDKQKRAHEALEETLSQLGSGSKAAGPVSYLGRSKLMSRAKSNSLSNQQFQAAQENGMKVYQPVGYSKYGNFVSKDANA
jgi:hypothetical protein